MFKSRKSFNILFWQIDSEINLKSIHFVEYSQNIKYIQEGLTSLWGQNYFVNSTWVEKNSLKKISISFFSITSCNARPTNINHTMENHEVKSLAL